MQGAVVIVAVINVTTSFTNDPLAAMSVASTVAFGVNIGVKNCVTAEPFGRGRRSPCEFAYSTTRKVTLKPTTVAYHTR